MVKIHLVDRALLSIAEVLTELETVHKLNTLTARPDPSTSPRTNGIVEGQCQLSSASHELRFLVKNQDILAT